MRWITTTGSTERRGRRARRARHFGSWARLAARGDNPREVGTRRCLDAGGLRQLRQEILIALTGVVPHDAAPRRICHQRRCIDADGCPLERAEAPDRRHPSRVHDRSADSAFHHGLLGAHRIGTNVLLEAAPADPRGVRARLSALVHDVPLVEAHHVGAFGATAPIAGCRPGSAAPFLAFPVVCVPQAPPSVVDPRVTSYSLRSESIGSICAARLAGT